MGDRAQLTTQSARERVQMQEGHNGCVCFPVLFVLGALMGGGNVGVSGRIGLFWGMGQKGSLDPTCVPKAARHLDLLREVFRRIKASLTPACSCQLPLTLLPSPHRPPIKLLPARERRFRSPKSSAGSAGCVST